MVRVTGPWEAESKYMDRVVPIAWNLGSVSHVGTLHTVDVEEKFRMLATINYNNHN